jgi:hypothetical protein
MPRLCFKQAVREKDRSLTFNFNENLTDKFVREGIMRKKRNEMGYTRTREAKTEEMQK